MDLYIADIEFLNEDKTESGVGGFVYAFLNAKDIEDVKQRISFVLKAQRKTVKDFRSIHTYDPLTEWGSDQLNMHYKNLAKLARQQDKVIFDTFYSYEKI